MNKRQHKCLSLAIRFGNLLSSHVPAKAKQKWRKALEQAREVECKNVDSGKKQTN